MDFKYFLLLLAFLVSGCSTSSLRSTYSSVVERSDDLTTRPEWATLNGTPAAPEGKQYFVGYIELDQNASKSAALNMSDEKALSEPFRSMVDQFLDQNQVGEELRGSTGQRIISSLRSARPTIADLQIVKRYWEVVETKSIGGYLRIYIRVYSLAEASSAEIDKAKQSLLMKLSGDLSVKKVLDDIGAKQRDQAMTAHSTEGQ